MKVLLGPGAKGFSAKTVSRLKREWAREYGDWREQPLDKEPWVYIWADGVYSGLRGEHDKLGQCAEENWRKLRGFDYLTKVITGIKFTDGIETNTNLSQITA